MLLKKIKYNLMKLIKNDFCIVFLKYIIRHRKIPKLKNPKTFNEKIAYNKLYSESELLAPLCDKYLVKEHIRKKIGDKYVLDTLFVTSKPESIPFNDLPNSFIIKATHGSGWNIIVKNKKEINFNDIVKKCNFFLSMNYYYLGRERQYKNIEPQIMIEKLLLDAKGEVPKDYKFFSFNGKIEFIQVDIDRGGSHKRNFYDCNWNRMPFELNYPSYEFDIEKPSRLNKMLKISENLSSGLDFARIDLYYISDKIYFGEITFTPENNLGRFYPMIYDRIWGERLKI
tara:strand:- start:81 stop:932 length:852 start_codon:yes stop_codon:yes gene_type:complete